MPYPATVHAVNVPAQLPDERLARNVQRQRLVEAAAVQHLAQRHRTNDLFRQEIAGISPGAASGFQNGQRHGRGDVAAEQFAGAVPGAGRARAAIAPQQARRETLHHRARLRVVFVRAKFRQRHIGQSAAAAFVDRHRPGPLEQSLRVNQSFREARGGQFRPHRAPPPTCLQRTHAHGLTFGNTEAVQPRTHVN